MEFKRKSVIDLYLAGKIHSEITRELKRLNVNKVFVYRTIKRYEETGSIAKRHAGGHKKTATSSEIISMVRKRIEQNPNLSSRKMATEFNISARSMQRILKNKLGLEARKIQGTKNPTSEQNSVGSNETSTSSAMEQNNKTNSFPDSFQCVLQPSQD